MKVSLNWISEFIKINKTPKEIADKITLSLSEVERVEKVGGDTVLEIENKALTHRPDCFSQLGLAREIGAYFSKKINDPLDAYYHHKFKFSAKGLNLNVVIENKKGCLRYSTIVLSNIKVGKSPEFIQNRLKLVNIRPINNVVDITNYVMMELGQPLHAFDYEKISGHKIIVRNARKGEYITTLDDVRRTLDDSMLVIADSRKPIAVAGIIGGKDSEVTENTKTIVLESASFDGQQTRKTAKKLGIRTEASTRFEKNLDSHLTKAGVVKAVELLEKYAGTKVASKYYDIRSPLPERKVIKTNASRINTILGLSLTPLEMKKLLERLELPTEIKKDDLIITVPTYRRDLNIEADIAEEVARIYGYDAIPTTLPKGDIIPPFKNQSIEMQYELKQILTGLGLYEAHLPSLIGKDTIKLVGEDTGGYIKLINPTNPEKTYFRRSLIESLLLVANFNSRYFKNFGIFEIGRIYNKTSKGKLPNEKIKVGSIFAYPKTDEIGNSFYKIKGIVEELFNVLGVPLPKFNPVNNHQVFQQRMTAEIGEYGILGKINPQISDWISKEFHFFAFEIDFDLLMTNRKGKYYKQIPNNPPIIEDFTFEFEKIPLIGNLIENIKSTDILMNQVDIIGTYYNSVTVRIYFQDPNKSLSSKDIDPVRKKMIETVEEKFKGKIKS